MAYPKAPKKEDVNAESRTVAPAAPGTERVVAPQAPSVRGGAPKVKPQAFRWQGAARSTGTAGTLPVPSMMTLPQTQEQIGQFVGQMKSWADGIVKQRPDVVQRNPRFWRAYQQYPEGMATMLARRAYTDQIAGSGPVADYMRWLEGLNK